MSLPIFSSRTNLKLHDVMEFQVRYLVLFLLFSVIDSFKWFWMRSLHKNIQLMLEFFKVPFLVLHFSYYILMTFLMMLSVILLPMLMILLSILSVIRHLICGNNYSCYLELLNKLQKRICRTVGPSLAASPEPLAHHQNVFSVGIALVDVHLNWLDWFHLLILEGGLLVILIDYMILLSPFLDIRRMSMSTVSFLTQLDSGILCL